MMPTIDFSDADLHGHLLEEPLNIEINTIVEAVALAMPRFPRNYLGASAGGDECKRKIQFEWLSSSSEGAQTRRRFDRGHAIEATMRAQLIDAGFAFAPNEALEFVALNYLAGHADGIIIAGPPLGGAYFQWPAIWENKCVYAKGWRSLAKHGLAATYPKYAVQTALYQRFLDKTNPALFTAVNADSCEALHISIPYDRDLADRATERIRQIIEVTKKGQLLERAYDDPKDWRCVAQCGHRERCWRLPP
jgi:hypothetical protein